MSYGLVGLGTMGGNLALNISEKHHLHIYNRSYAKTQAVNSANVSKHKSLDSLIETMPTPRTIVTMLPHGDINYENIAYLSTIMSPGDVLMDCANELHTQSLKNGEICKKNNINYLGVGMSGGAAGARYGPAVMVGGHANKNTLNYLDSFCKNVTYIDENNDSGHFVKTVHNGIEYSMLQGIADVFAFYNYDISKMNSLCERLLGTYCDGYLINSVFGILNKYDLPNIVDNCKMNNTGLWCVEYAYKHGINVPTMHAAVQARVASTIPKSVKYQKNTMRTTTDVAFYTLFFVYAMAVYEGLQLIKHKGIDTNVAQDAWSYATIIECPMIKKSEKELLKIMKFSHNKARMMILDCVRNGVPVPVVSAALQNYDLINQKHSQMHFVMAQRNYFGQHPLEFYK